MTYTYFCFAVFNHMAFIQNAVVPLNLTAKPHNTCKSHTELHNEHQCVQRWSCYCLLANVHCELICCLRAARTTLSWITHDLHQRWIVCCCCPNSGTLPADITPAQFFRFYPRDAMLARVIVIATCLSVRPSVRLSRAGIVSKRRKLHHLVAPRL